MRLDKKYVVISITDMIESIQRMSGDNDSGAHTTRRYDVYPFKEDSLQDSGYLYSHKGVKYIRYYPERIREDLISTFELAIDKPLDDEVGQKLEYLECAIDDISAEHRKREVDGVKEDEEVFDKLREDLFHMQNVDLPRIYRGKLAEVYAYYKVGYNSEPMRVLSRNEVLDDFDWFLGLLK